VAAPTSPAARPRMLESIAERYTQALLGRG
jgi:hypothetical protein